MRVFIVFFFDFLLLEGFVFVLDLELICLVSVTGFILSTLTARPRAFLSVLGFTLWLLTARPRCLWTISLKRRWMPGGGR